MSTVPAATVTPQAIDWPKGYVIAPDAFYHRALVHLDNATRTVDIYNLQGTKQATYTLADGYTYDETRLELRGVIEGQPDDDTGLVIVRPDSGCSCMGYKRTAR